MGLGSGETLLKPDWSCTAAVAWRLSWCVFVCSVYTMFVILLVDRHHVVHTTGTRLKKPVFWLRQKRGSERKTRTVSFWLTGLVHLCATVNRVKEVYHFIRMNPFVWERPRTEDAEVLFIPPASGRSTDFCECECMSVSSELIPQKLQSELNVTKTTDVSNPVNTKINGQDVKSVESHKNFGV